MYVFFRFTYEKSTSLIITTRHGRPSLAMTPSIRPGAFLYVSTLILFLFIYLFFFFFCGTVAVPYLGPVHNHFWSHWYSCFQAVNRKPFKPFFDGETFLFSGKPFLRLIFNGKPFFRISVENVLIFGVFFLGRFLSTHHVLNWTGLSARLYAFCLGAGIMHHLVHAEK